MRVKCTNSRNRIINKLRYGIIGWWALWYIIALIFYGNLSTKVSILVLISLIGFFLGSIHLTINEPTERGHYFWAISSIKVPIYFLTAIIFWQIILAIRSAGAIAELGSSFREEYFGGFIQKSNYLFVLYEQLIIPLGIFFIILWLCRKQHGGLWFLYTTAFFMLDAIIKLGRFPLYYYVFFLVLGHIMGTFKLSFLRIVPMLIVLPVSSVYLLLARKSFTGILDMQLLSNIIDKSIIKYHIIGFYLLDFLKDDPIFPKSFLFPNYTFGYFHYILSLIGRRFGFSFEYPQQVLNIALTEPTYLRTVGDWNAFSTIILPFYLDGGIIFSFIMFYFLGYLLRTGPGVGFRTLSPLNVISVFIMFFGLFQPIAITCLFFVPILAHFIYNVAGRAYRTEKRKMLPNTSQ